MRIPLIQDGFKTGLCLLATLAAPAVFGQSDPYRGLWVGQVTLKYVNEVSVPLDEDNVAIAPDPQVPTPTADEAHLRLILHVNGAGQVSLLKDVAVLNRRGNPTSAGVSGSPVNLTEQPAVLSSDSDRLEADSDVALVTDERLYGEFPPQPAIRIGSATFDFGDSRATDALNDLVANAVNAAASAIFGAPQSSFATAAARKTLEDATTLTAKNAAEASVPKADVAAAFGAFLQDSFDSADVNAVADATSASAVLVAAQPAAAAAASLRDGSFYKDTRGVQMVNAVITAVQDALGDGANQAARRKIAQNTAAAYADVNNDYQRFIAGKAFGDMISGAAAAAGGAAVEPNATATSIRAAVGANLAVIEGRSQAQTYRVAIYQDTRSADAVELVLDAVINNAASALPASPGARLTIEQNADGAGRAALADNVSRSLSPVEAPTLEYNQFVISDAFKASPDTAARAAAAAAISERVNNALYTEQSLKNAALVGAATALRDVFAAAARTVRTELPLAGRFGPGRGDPRLTFEIRMNNEPALGSAGLEGTLFLPASHPTNPFRHRRHPDHTAGFDLVRKLRLDFNGSQGDALGHGGFQVDQITGTYREEVVGLHKPLGPNKDIGLKVEGTFELNRISLIDTLNAR